MKSVKTFFHRLFRSSRSPCRLRSPRFLLKWLFLSTVIGSVAGIGAIAFSAAIHLASDELLGGLVGYFPPDPTGEGQTRVMSLWSAMHPWLLPVVTTLGGLAVGILVFSLASEAEGHGTDAAIAAFHQGKPIRARIPLVKLVASAITIGTGGSAGHEGPTAQINAGFGSILARVLRLDTQDRRIALATGIGAGIGAIFRAPLGGAILAAEILYKDDLEVEAIIPALMASIVGYSIFGSWSGWNPIFSTPANLAFSSPPQLLYYVLLGVLCGLVGLMYVHVFYGMTHLFHHLHLPRWIKPAVGGLCVGLIGLVLPQALGMGYGWVQVSMGTGLLGLPLWVIIALPFAKIVTTGLTVGSGGSGGIFGPGMVMGGMLGAMVWRVCYHVLPGVPDLPGPFVIVGMMALFGGIARAPLAVMLMVAEMTGNLSMLAPAMIAVGLSYLIVGQETIYRSQPETRADSPAHRPQLTFPLLATLSVRSAMTAIPVVLRETQTLAEAAALLASHDWSGAPVLDEQGTLHGVLTERDIERVSEAERAERRVVEAMRREVVVIQADGMLDEVLEVLTTHRMSWAPVAETHGQGHRVVGVVSSASIMQLYHTTSTKDVRRMRGLEEGTIMQEVQVKPEMILAGRALRDAALPTGCLVVSIKRGATWHFPQGGAVILPGDIITLLMNPQGESQWQEYVTRTTSERAIPPSNA